MHMIRSNIFFYNFYKRYHTKVKKLKLYYAREVCKIIMITPIYIMTFKYDNITRERFSYYFLYEVRTLEFVYIFLIIFGKNKFLHFGDEFYDAQILYLRNNRVKILVYIIVKL